MVVIDEAQSLVSQLKMMNCQTMLNLDYGYLGKLHWPNIEKPTVKPWAFLLAK